jgi:hypothetical protein
MKHLFVGIAILLSAAAPAIAQQVTATPDMQLDHDYHVCETHHLTITKTINRRLLDGSSQTVPFSLPSTDYASGWGNCAVVRKEWQAKAAASAADTARSNAGRKAREDAATQSRLGSYK